MKRVVVVTTGGTIASRANPQGAQVATLAGDELMWSVPVAAGTTVEVLDLFSLNSYAMDLAAMDDIRRAVDQALMNLGVDGVVVAHGTDTLEETSFLLDLFHDDPRPVVFTGAQRSSDTVGGDGVANLADAIVLAASAAARDLGVLTMFDGVVYAARGTRKVHTSSMAAFDNPDMGPVGHLARGRLTINKVPTRSAPLPSPLRSFALAGVDIVAIYPGVSATAITAYAAAGARGIVLEGTGLGNANSQVAGVVRRLVQDGLTVVLTTRVHAGLVEPVYGGGGGGFDLVNAGAVPAGYLRPSQARILLASLLVTDAPAQDIAAAFCPQQLPRPNNDHHPALQQKESQ